MLPVEFSGFPLCPLARFPAYSLRAALPARFHDLFRVTLFGDGLNFAPYVFHEISTRK
jgi:hypothetical protein